MRRWKGAITLNNIVRIGETELNANFDILEIKLSLDEIISLLKGEVIEDLGGDIKVIIKQKGVTND